MKSIERAEEVHSFIQELELAYESKNKGKLAEICVREKLKGFPGVELIEPATPEEEGEKDKKIDFWLKIKDWPEIIGVQFTVAEWDREYLMLKAAKFPRRVPKEGKLTTVIFCEPDHQTAQAVKRGVEHVVTDRDEKGSFSNIDIESEGYVPKSAVWKIYGVVLTKYIEARPELAVTLQNHLRRFILP